MNRAQRAGRRCAAPTPEHASVSGARTGAAQTDIHRHVAASLGTSPPRRDASSRCPCGGDCPRCAGAGQPLAAPVRTAMEARLGASLADVRVHADAPAAHAAARAGAHAYTIGSDVYFAAGKFAPHTPEGATRLAHELVHVEQQRAGQRGAAHADRRSAEREARELGLAVASGQRVTVRAAAPHAMQRDGPDSEGSPGPSLASAVGPQLHLDPEVARLMLQHFIRWWLGGALVSGAAPTSLPVPRSAGGHDSDATAGGPGTAAPGVGPTISAGSIPTLVGPTISQDNLQLPLVPDLYAPLPPDPLLPEPDAGALFSPFGARGAPVGPGDSDAVMTIYRRNAAIARELPDLRSIAPHFIRPLIPLTWRRDIASAMTGAAVGAYLKRDYMTPIEVSDRAWQGMTGASTTMIPLPSISFDLF